MILNGGDPEGFSAPIFQRELARGTYRTVAFLVDPKGLSLKNFGNYIVRNDLMNSSNNGIVERSTSYLNSLREQIKALSKQSHYESYKESFQAHPQLEVPEEVVEEPVLAEPTFG
jgi:hypothetical protein